MAVNNKVNMKLMTKLIFGALVLFSVSCTMPKVIIPIKDAVYYDKYQAEITDLRKARSYGFIIRDSVDKNVAVARNYFMSGKLKSEVKLANEATLADREWKMKAVRMMFMDTDDKTLWTLNGKYNEWYESGKPKKIINYKNGYIVNRLQVFWENGQIKRNEKYDENSKFIIGECYDKTGDKVPFTRHSTDAYFSPNSGYRSVDEYLRLNINYPQAALQYKDAGIVFIYHYLDARGRNYKNVIRYPLNPILNEEALRVVRKMPDMFFPATEDDEPCSFVKTISVRFNLPAFTVNLLRTSGQKDSLYFDKNGYISKSRLQAETMELYIPTANDSNLVVRTIFNKQAVKTAEITIDKKKTIRNLEINYPNLNVNSTNPILADINRYQVVEGPSIRYYENGNIKQKTVFENGKLTKPTENFNMDGSKIEDSNRRNKIANDSIKIYSVVERMPQFQGGESELSYFIRDNLRFPVKAMEEKVSGTVIVSFVVLADGSIGEIKIVRSLSPETDAEAKRVISILARFTPGMQNGKNVAVWYTLPISFRSM
ncbi:MAG: TonB family protein [Paludibacter sp.]